jgi:hypothetical protein
LPTLGPSRPVSTVPPLLSTVPTIITLSFPPDPDKIWIRTQHLDGCKFKNYSSRKTSMLRRSRFGLFASGSTDPIESGKGASPDPKLWYYWCLPFPFNCFGAHCNLSLSTFSPESIQPTAHCSPCLSHPTSVDLAHCAALSQQRPTVTLPFSFFPRVHSTRSPLCPLLVPPHIC